MLPALPVRPATAAVPPNANCVPAGRRVRECEGSRSRLTGSMSAHFLRPVTVQTVFELKEDWPWRPGNRRGCDLWCEGKRKFSLEGGISS